MRAGRQKVRRSPQISLNLLGEFMVSSFARRRSILREAKFPKDYIGLRYDPAQKAAARSLTDSGKYLDRLREDIGGLLAKVSKSRWLEDRQKLWEQAVDCVSALEDALKLDGLDVVRGGDTGHRLELGGVSVTAVPDLLVRSEGRGGSFLGALKFRYVKTKPLAQEWAAYSTTLLHRFAEERLGGPGSNVDRRHCKLIDVFAGRIYEAPACQKERRKDIEAACWHIKELWPSVQMEG